MKIAIQRLSVGNKEYLFYFDELHNPVIELENKIYSLDSIHDLLLKNPILIDQVHLVKAVKIINFLIKGITFHVIDNIEAFQQQYIDKIEQESYEIPKNGRLSNYGKFDLEELHLPKFLDGHLYFYVKEDATQLPYQVVFAITPSEGRAIAEYNLLTYA